MRNYQVKHKPITVNHTDYLIRSLKDRRQFHDHENRARALGISSASWPLSDMVWPASRGLTATVCLLELDGKRVLEIGCGTELSDIVLHSMGADITASDYHPLAREFLEANVLANKLLPIKFQTGNQETEKNLSVNSTRSSAATCYMYLTMPKPYHSSSTHIHASGLMS